MIRGTTPDYILTVDADLTGTSVYVTIQRGVNKLTLTGDDLQIASDGTASTITFQLTQQQTLAFGTGTAEVQVKFISADGTTRATNIQPIRIGRALLDRVVAYNG